MSATSSSSFTPFHTEIDFSSIPQHPAGYVKFPKYVYENCNQQVCNNYEEQFLEKIRAQTKNITVAQKEMMRRIYKDKDALTKKEEELDWVYGLDHLEVTYLSDPAFRQKKTPFTIDEIIHVNGLLSRSANSAPGEFRKRNINWGKIDLSINEGMGFSLISGRLCDNYNISPKDELTTDLFRKISDPFCENPPASDIKITALTAFMTRFKKKPELSRDIKTGGLINANQINPDLAKEWGKECPGKSKGSIDGVKWLKNRYHFFPTGKQVPLELQNSLEIISSNDMHPIEKACRIWFDIIRIHISHEANKREGKAIGSVILLTHGYLPPEITGEDGKMYVKVLEEGFEAKNGHVPFMHFIVERMKKTYEKYSAVPGYLEKYQAPETTVNKQASQ